ncbi:alkylhydroperoxidase AhpD family core domain protein, partial [mine drainage metagenome]
MAKSKPSVARSYLLEHRANTTKINKITAVLPEFQMACKTVQAQQMRVFVQDGEKFWNRRGLQPFQTQLSKRYKRSVQNQVVTGLSSWLELSKTAIKNIIARSSLPSEVKADLWWLNQANAHYAKEQPCQCGVSLVTAPDS